MLKLTQQQALDRWDTLPDILREALVSETNAEILWQKGEAEHLPKEKISVVAALTGHVLMGFLHPEDLAGEIQDVLGINPNIAAAVANALNSRIFNPLRNELEKIYAPAGLEAGRPKIVQEIERPFDAAQGKPNTSAVPVGIPSKTVSVAGVPFGPKIISTEAIPTAAPTPSAPSTINIPQFPKPPTQQKLGESFKKEQPQGPVILHQESELAPIKSVSGFRLEIPEQESKGIKSDSAIPPRPAQIEIGPVMEIRQKPAGESQKSSVISQKSATPVTRVVHYSESRTPLAPEKTSQGTQASSPPAPFSTLVEITSQPLKPIIPVPMPPRPADLPALLQPKKDAKSMEVRSGGVLNRPALSLVKRLTQKIFPAKKLLPDPLKEPELPAPK